MIRSVDWREPAWMRALVYLASAGMILAAAVATGAESVGPGAPSTRVQIASDPQPFPDFTLTGTDAKAVRFSDLRGGTVLVFFGFTNCQSVCPPTLQKLRQVSRSFAATDPDLTTVLISVDGERDTPAAMRAYLEPFQPGFLGLTGEPLLVRDVAARFSAVFFKGLPRDRSGAYDVEHSSQVYVVDGQGRLRATFFNATVDEMTSVIRRVMSEDAEPGKEQAVVGLNAG
jgi:protein SCO1/2